MLRFIKWLAVIVVITLVGTVVSLWRAGSALSPAPVDSPSVSQNASGAAHSPAPNDETEPKPRPRRRQTTVPESSRRMAQRLKDLVDRADANPEAYTYSNGKRAALFKQRLAAKSPDQRTVVEFVRLMQELLYDGQTHEALKYLKIVQSMPVDRTVRSGPQFDRFLKEFEALANFRLGEQENCIHHHSINSCLFPIQGDGIHTIQKWSRRAIAFYSELLDESPSDLNYRWMLNLAYMTLGEHPHQVPKKWLIPPAAFASDYQIPRFNDVAQFVGLAHVGLSGGAAMDDFNGDGLLDVVKSSWGLADQLQYFENNGDGTFVNRTEEALLVGQIGGLNLTHADYDNDGDLDILVLRGAWLGDKGRFPNSLLRNYGDGTFEDVTEQAGILSYFPTPSAAWGDYDNDGWLDVFIANESRGPQSFPCELYHNNRDGTFTNLAAQMGVAHVGFVKGAAWGDFDNDGRLDLYLSRMSQPNVLYRNDGARFTDVTKTAGVSLPIGSFPTWFFDYDNDGWLDLLAASFSGFGKGALPFVVAEYLNVSVGETHRCHLYRNRGDGTFEDVSAAVRLDRALLAMGANFGDIDNDGYLDCYFGTGEPRYTSLVPNLMFRNDAGRRFQDVTTAGGFGHLQKGHGIAFGDIDNDGDQDIFAVMGGAYSGDVFQSVLFENPGNKNHWLTLRLRGVRSNRAGVGARVRIVVVDADGRRRQIHRVGGETGSFGSSSMQLEVGLGACQRIEELLIRWPAGDTTDVWKEVPLDQVLAVEEGNPQLRPINTPRFTLRRTASPGGAGHAHHHHHHTESAPKDSSKADPHKDHR